MARVLGRNSHQKAAHRVGERRVGPEDVADLLRMSESADAEERLAAARFLCPCHVRRRLEPVWQALYRLLEDADVRVRRAAWHTMEDGGRPADPALDAILARVLEAEKDAQVLKFARGLASPRLRQELAHANAASRPAPSTRGRCDFCAADNVLVTALLDAIIPGAGGDRPAYICQPCERTS